jgi:arylsulfatase
MRMISSVGASIGADRGSAVSRRYRAPFPYSGTLHDIEIQLVARADAAAEADVATAEARAGMSRQ